VSATLGGGKILIKELKKYSIRKEDAKSMDHKRCFFIVFGGSYQLELKSNL